MANLVEAIADLREAEALALVGRTLEGGGDPAAVIGECREAMAIVGQRFESGSYFLPDLIYAGEIMREISEQVKPCLRQAEGEGKKGARVLVATVKGDIHDIGKNIVVFMLDVNGFEVLDLGVDVAPQTVVEQINAFQPSVVALSGLLTVAHTSMKETVEAVRAAGLRDRVKIMLGGGSTDEHVRTFSGADAFGADAVAAVTLAKQWTGVD